MRGRRMPRTEVSPGLHADAAASRRLHRARGAVGPEARGKLWRL